MAAGRLLNPPDPLQLSSGNVSQNCKRFKQKWSNYDLAIGTARKEDPIRVATFLTVIGDEALDVYNAFTWDSDEDKVKMDKVLEHFEQYCEPRKNTIYERYLFFSRGQESWEPIDKYATVLRNMAGSCQFQDLKGSLIRDHIVFGIADNNVRERLLRVSDLTLNKALEIARAVEATQSQLKQMQNVHEVNAVGKKKGKFFRKKQEEKKKSANGSTQQIDCKFCGRKHVPDRSKCPAYGQQCNKCGKSNHFAAKCTGGSHSSRNLHANQNLNYVQEDSDGSQFEEYTIDVITYQVSAVEEKKHPKQLFTSVKVNNAKDVTFQLDCGATCNLLSLKEFSSIMGDPKDLYLKKTSAILKMDNGTTMTPLGKCTLKCAKGEMSRDADFL